MYPAEIVAKYIITKCNQDGKCISNLKLQKVLYFVQVEFLVAKGCPCFPERIEAWDFGPVVPDIYYKYKIYGGANIPIIEESSSRILSPNDKVTIDEIIDFCAKYSASAKREAACFFYFQRLPPFLPNTILPKNKNIPEKFSF